MNTSKWIIKTAVVLSCLGVTMLSFSGKVLAQTDQDQAPLSPVIPAKVLPPPVDPPDPGPLPPPVEDPEPPWYAPRPLPPWYTPWPPPLPPVYLASSNLGSGTNASNPILPTSTTLNNGSLTFNIRVNVTTGMVGSTAWVDPVIAVGYDYFIDHGPSVKDIELPEGIGDNKYNLWIFNPALNDFTDSGVELIGGEKYKFEKPVRKFSIRGIEIEAGLDPENQRAFPTGLAFNRTGKVKMRMVPITVDTDKQ